MFFYEQIFMSFLLMQAVFSMSQLQYFQLSTIVELYKKNQETQKFCPLALIFHLAPYLIFIAVLKSTYPERMVLVTQYKQYFHVSAPLLHFYTGWTCNITGLSNVLFVNHIQNKIYLYIIRYEGKLWLNFVSKKW